MDYRHPFYGASLWSDFGVLSTFHNYPNKKFIVFVVFFSFSGIQWQEYAYPCFMKVFFASVDLIYWYFLCGSSLHYGSQTSH